MNKIEPRMFGAYRMSGEKKENYSLIDKLPPSYQRHVLSPFIIVAKKINPHPVMIDFASGLGGAADYFNSQGFKAIKVDPSKDALFAAQGDKVIAKADRNYSLPFKDLSVDTIHMKDAMVHINDQHYFFEELYRILKPNGLLLITNTDYDDGPFFVYRYKMPFGLNYERRKYFKFPSDYENCATSLLNNIFIRHELIGPPYYPVKKKDLEKFAFSLGLEKKDEKTWKPDEDEKDWYKDERRFVLVFEKI